jgi:starvation-inducible DNA-binding protein
MTQVLEAPTTRSAMAAPALQQTLVELIELALQGKHAHWNVEGPFFKPVHEQLDELVDQYREWYDDVAERLAAIGEPADGRAATVATTADLEPLPAGPLADRDVVEAFDTRVALVARRIEDRAAAMDEDLASQDLLVEILRGLDKQRWMLRVQRG